MVFRNTSRSLTAAGVLFMVGTCGLPAQDQKSAPTSAQMEQVVHDYILAHPDVMLESIKNFQVRAQLESKKKAQDNIATHRNELQEDPASPVLHASLKSNR